MREIIISAHAVQGDVHNPNGAEIVLYDNPAMGVRATIAPDLNRHLDIINRQLALASMLLRRMTGDPLRDNFQQNLKTQIESIERQRRDASGADPVVIVEIHKEVDAAIPADARSIDNFVLCFDAFDKNALRSELQSQVTAILTGLRIGGGGNYRFRPIADGSYLLNAQGQVVHSLAVGGGVGGVYVSTPLKDEQIAQIGRDIELAVRNVELSRVMRLYAHSLNTSTDNYRAFISAWSALEILIAKIFPTYQELLLRDLRGIIAAPGLHAYLDRIADVMKDKHSLADKFSVISVFLDPESERDIEVFRGIKKTRDRISHGEEIPYVHLPTSDVQNLFDKYLRNHVRRNP